MDSNRSNISGFPAQADRVGAQLRTGATAPHLKRTEGGKDISHGRDWITETAFNESKDDVSSRNSTERKLEDRPNHKVEAEQKNNPSFAAGYLNSLVNIYRTDADQGWTSKKPLDLEPAENEETGRYAIVLRHEKSSDSRKKYKIHSIVIQSPQIKEALSDILQGYPGVFCSLDRLVFEAPFQPFVHRWERFLEFMDRDNDHTTRDHMQLLYAVLKNELKDTIKALKDYIAHGVLMFEHAWTVFQPGAVVLSCAAGTTAMKFRHGAYVETRYGNVYRLFGERIDWDGARFGWVNQVVDLPGFSGIQSITSLPVIPLTLHPTMGLIKTSLVKRGRRFERLAGYHYKRYKGFAIEHTSDGPQKLQHDGRIIVDTSSWNKQRNTRSVYVDALGASDASSNNPTGGFGNESSSRDRDNAEAIESNFAMFQTTNLLPEEEEEKRVALTDYHCMLCAATVRGYSLKAKKWLEFFVEYITEIEWNDAAYRSLVLPQEQKKLILALSKSQAASLNIFDDVIQGKGKGMIILLSGPPGVGKTLTAEAVSEDMRIPLYTMSAGDLGLEPGQVESNLEAILTMVTRWNAMLLIDECDVFLEARSVHDLERNKLVSIFLRLLEYYQGTLFLTTNRVENIDSAFQSRIHVHMAYLSLTSESRRQIWDNFISRLKMTCDFSERDLEELAQIPLNGRQIKNTIKTSQLLAAEEQKTLCKRHVDVVLAFDKGIRMSSR